MRIRAKERKKERKKETMKEKERKKRPLPQTDTKQAHTCNKHS
jgi:hypothetical protein